MSRHGGCEFWLISHGEQFLALLGRQVSSTQSLCVAVQARLFAMTAHNTQPGAGGELQLTDAIQSLLGQEQVLAYEYEGVRYDCGSKLGYLKATVEFALRHPEVKDGFSEFLKTR